MTFQNDQLFQSFDTPSWPSWKGRGMYKIKVMCLLPFSNTGKIYFKSELIFIAEHLTERHLSQVAVRASCKTDDVSIFFYKGLLTPPPIPPHFSLPPPPSPSPLGSKILALERPPPLALRMCGHVHKLVFCVVEVLKFVFTGSVDYFSLRYRCRHEVNGTTWNQQRTN